MTEREPIPDKLSVADAMTQALLKGHAMRSFERDPDLGWPTATCGACGLRMFQYPDGTIAGPPLMIECQMGRAARQPRS